MSLYASSFPVLLFNVLIKMYRTLNKNCLKKRIATLTFSLRHPWLFCDLHLIKANMYGNVKKLKAAHKVNRITFQKNQKHVKPKLHLLIFKTLYGDNHQMQQEAEKVNNTLYK